MAPAPSSSKITPSSPNLRMNLSSPSEWRSYAQPSGHRLLRMTTRWSRRSRAISPRSDQISQGRGSLWPWVHAVGADRITAEQQIHRTRWRQTRSPDLTKPFSHHRQPIEDLVPANRLASGEKRVPRGDQPFPSTVMCVACDVFACLASSRFIHAILAGGPSVAPLDHRRRAHGRAGVLLVAEDDLDVGEPLGTPLVLE